MRNTHSDFSEDSWFAGRGRDCGSQFYAPMPSVRGGERLRGFRDPGISRPAEEPTFPTACAAFTGGKGISRVWNSASDSWLEPSRSVPRFNLVCRSGTLVECTKGLRGSKCSHFLTDTSIVIALYNACCCFFPARVPWAGPCGDRQITPRVQRFAPQTRMHPTKLSLAPEPIHEYAIVRLFSAAVVSSPRRPYRWSS